ncbi:MAG: phage portal protein [Patescibacteria group bacterium]
MKNKLFENISAKVKNFFGNDDRYSLYNSVDRQNFANKGATEYLNYNDISLYVNRAIEARAEKVSEIQFVLKDKNGDIIADHAILNLLNKPNEFHTGKQFWKLFQKYYDITGNAYIFLKKKLEIFKLDEIEAMYLLKPDCVKVIRDSATGVALSYEYKVGSQTTIYKAEEILHCFNPDPQSPIEGASLLKAGIRAIETEISLEEYQANILANGGKVEGIFKFKNGLTKTLINEAKEKFIEDIAGAKKSGRPLFLSADADYQNVSLNPTELSYLESKKATLNDICILAGTPQAILASVGDQTFANADASLKIFVRDTIKPLDTNLANFLDWRLVPMDMELTYIDPTPEDIDYKIKKINALYQTDSSTINERRAIMDLDPLAEEDADKVLVSFAKTPLGQSDNSSTIKIFKRKDLKDGEFIHPLREKAFRDMYRNVQIKRMDKKESIFFSAMKIYFADQETRLKSHLTGIKTINKKGLVDDIFNQNLELNLAKGMAIPILRRMMLEAGQDATEMLDYQFGFTMSSALEKWLDDRANLFAKEITNTTYDRLSKQFSESFDNGETRQQLIERIKETYNGFDDTRARTIARTEVHGATQKATIEGNRQAGSPIKIWVAVMDDSTRDSHAMLDGEERPIDMPFSNGLMYAGDTRGEASEVINCRCQN